MELRLLVLVDDDDGFRDSLSQLITEADGYGVLAYPSAEECLADPRSAAADCVLIDVLMPGTDGPALAEALRVRGCEAPILFLTGDAEKSRNEAVRQAQAVVEKPFRVRELLDIVDAAIAHTG